MEIDTFIKVLSIMKFINENAPAIGVLLLVVSMVVGVTVWVVTEINDVRDDLHDTEMRLTDKINENAAGIAQINARLDRIEQSLDAVLEAIANHSHAEDGSPTFTRPTKTPRTPKTKTRPRRDR